MPAPIYKCPDCGAKVIYNEKKNCWKCQKCGQELSESDVFVQGLEEWRADAPKVSVPSAEPIADYDYGALLIDFLNDNDSIKASDILQKFGLLLPIVVAVALGLAVKNILVPIFIFAGGCLLLVGIRKGVYRGLAHKVKKYFSEIEDINDKGTICGGSKFYRSYWLEREAEEGKTGDNYKCNIGGKVVCFNDFTLGRWEYRDRSPHFVPISRGQGVRVMHKLNLNHFITICKCGFPYVIQKFQVSGSDYFKDEAYSQYTVRTINKRSLSEWKISGLKMILKNIEAIVSEKYHCSFELVFERQYITLLFRPGFSAFCAGFKEKSDMYPPKNKKYTPFPIPPSSSIT